MKSGRQRASKWHGWEKNWKNSTRPPAPGRTLSNTRFFHSWTRWPLGAAIQRGSCNKPFCVCFMFALGRSCRRARSQRWFEWCPAATPLMPPFTKRRAPQKVLRASSCGCCAWDCGTIERGSCSERQRCWWGHNTPEDPVRTEGELPPVMKLERAFGANSICLAARGSEGSDHLAWWHSMCWRQGGRRMVLPCTRHRDGPLAAGGRRGELHRCHL